MNENKVAVIINKTNDKYYEECVNFLNYQTLPENMQLDILCVTEKENLMDAYQEGMEASDAKYKIYISEKCLLLYKKLISEIISYFKKNNKLGIIGVLGSNDIKNSTSGSWNVGSAILNNGYYAEKFNENATNNLTIVDILHPCFIATQFDEDWNIEKLDSEISNVANFCIRANQKGYQIGCIQSEHDLIYFCENMIDFNYWNTEMKEYKNKCNSFIEKNILLDIEQIEKNLSTIQHEETEYFRMRNFLIYKDIYELEKESEENISWYFKDPSIFEELFIEIRCELLRVKYGLDDIKNVVERIKNLKVSDDLIRTMHSQISVDKINTDILQIDKCEEEPLVSVVITNYNGHGYLNRAIESAINQTYKNLEIIVVDDYSTDDSREIIESFSKDTRVKGLFMEKNRHVCYACNQGFKISKGKYVALLSYDDFWKPDKIEKQITFLEKHNDAVCCFSKCEVVNEDGIAIKSGFDQIFTQINLTRKELFKHFLTKGNCICATTACIRKDALFEAGFYKLGLLQLQDFELWLRLLNYGKMYIYPDKLTNYTRFCKSLINLSSKKDGSENRCKNENKYIWNDAIWNMKSQVFKEYFIEEFRNKESNTDEEITCEKVFFLFKVGSSAAINHMMDLLEDEKMFHVLEDKFSFTTKDFYELSAKDYY